MSLINEALKKAQRQRHEEAPSSGATAATPEPAAGVPIARRGKAPAANTLVLIGSGAVVLVVLSVVLTVYLINRPADTARPSPATVATAPKTPAPAAESTPAIVPPALPTPAPATATVTPSPTAGPASMTSSQPMAVPSNAATTSAPAAAGPVTAGTVTAITPPSTPVQTPQAAVAQVTAESNSATSTPTAQAAPSPASRGPDERVAAFVEAIRVTGIRSSGSESRVLMNERVYRVNDIVDRALGVKLTKVAADSLTFADPNGVTYEKHF